MLELRETRTNWRWGGPIEWKVRKYREIFSQRAPIQKPTTSSIQRESQFKSVSIHGKMASVVDTFYHLSYIAHFTNTWVSKPNYSLLSLNLLYIYPTLPFFSSHPQIHFHCLLRLSQTEFSKSVWVFGSLGLCVKNLSVVCVKSSWEFITQWKNLVLDPLKKKTPSFFPLFSHCFWILSALTLRFLYTRTFLFFFFFFSSNSKQGLSLILWI